MLRFREVSTGSGGFAACRECGPVPAAAYRDADAVLADIAEAAAEVAGPLNVSLSGAEPFGHPDLPAIVAGARERGAARVRLVTDGVALGRGDNAAGALGAGVRHARVVLFGGSAEEHDGCVGALGHFDAALDGAREFLRAASARDLPVALSGEVRLCRHNISHASASVAALAAVGAGAVFLRVLGSRVDPDDLGTWVAAACDTGVVNRVWVSVEGVPSSALVGRELHLARESAGAVPA